MSRHEKGKSIRVERSFEQRCVRPVLSNGSLWATSSRQGDNMWPRLLPDCYSPHCFLHCWHNIGGKKRHILPSWQQWGECSHRSSGVLHLVGVLRSLCGVQPLWHAAHALCSPGLVTGVMGSSRPLWTLDNWWQCNMYWKFVDSVHALDKIKTHTIT